MLEFANRLENCKDKYEGSDISDGFENWEINSRIDNIKLCINIPSLNHLFSKSCELAYNYLLKYQSNHQNEIGRSSSLSKLFLMSHGIVDGEQKIAVSGNNPIYSKILDLFVQRYGFMGISKLPAIMYGMSDSDTDFTKNEVLLGKFYDKLLPKALSQKGVDNGRIEIMAYLITGHFDELIKNANPELKLKYSSILCEVDKINRSYFFSSEVSLKGELFTGLTTYNKFITLLQQSDLWNKKGLSKSLDRYMLEIESSTQKLNPKTGTYYQSRDRLHFKFEDLPDYIKGRRLNSQQTNYYISIIEPLKRSGLGGIALLEATIQSIGNGSKNYLDSIRHVLVFLGNECNKNPNFNSDMMAKLLADITGESNNFLDIADRNIETAKNIGVFISSMLLYFALAPVGGIVLASAISGAYYNAIAQMTVDKKNTLDYPSVLKSAVLSACLGGFFGSISGKLEGKTRSLVAKELLPNCPNSSIGILARNFLSQISKVSGNIHNENEFWSKFVTYVTRESAEETIDYHILSAVK